MCIRKIIIFVTMSIVFLLYSFSVVSVIAESNEAKVRLNSLSINQGSQSTITLSIENIEDYSALELRMFYDEDLFEVSGASFTWIHNNMPAHQKAFNIDEPGTVSYILALSESTTINGALLHIHFRAITDAELGKYIFNVGVVGVYDDDQNPIMVKGEHGIVTVVEPQEPIEVVHFNGSISQNNLEIEDTFTFRIWSHQLYKMASGQFEIYYEREHFEVLDVVLGDQLLGEGVLSDINTSNRGFINIAFASAIGLDSANSFVEVTFKVLIDEASNTEIRFLSKSTYDEDLEILSTNSVVNHVSTVQSSEVVVHPKLMVSDHLGPLDQRFDLIISIEEASSLAAGDFTIKFDEMLFELEAIEAMYNSSYLVFNHQENTNKITFSLLEPEGIEAEESLLKLTFKPISQDEAVSTVITIEGTNVVDKNIDKIDLEFVDGFVELDHFYQITFIDFDESIIEVVSSRINTFPEISENPKRAGTIFIGWHQEVVEANEDVIYQAVYALDLSLIAYDNETIIYDGNNQEVLVTDFPEGAHVEYTNNGHKDVGEYFVEAAIYLDDVLQTERVSKLTIIPRPLNVIVDDAFMDELGELPEWSYQVEGHVNNDNLGLSIFSKTGYDAGEHIITATIDNDNYQVSVTEATLTVHPYEWIYGDLNFDEVVSVKDVALLQLYLAGVYTFTPMQEQIADANQDDKVDITDVAIMQLYIAGLYPDWKQQPEDVESTLSIQSIVQSTASELELTFNDVTYVYDGTVKQLKLEGEVPYWVTSIQYANHRRTEAGTQFGVVSFVVQEGYDPIPNMIAKLTVEKAVMENIAINDETVIFDGTSHQLTFKNTVTQYGDEIEVVSDFSSYVNPGVYEETILVTHPNYHDQVIVGRLEILKRITSLEYEDISIEIESDFIEIDHVEQNRLMVSIDGLTYKNISRIDGLEEDTFYTVTIYLKETAYNQMSPIITIEHQTYLSLNTVYNQLETLNTFFLENHECLTKIEKMIDRVVVEDQAEAQRIFNMYVEDYNAQVTALNQEYNRVYQDHSTVRKPFVNLLSIPIVGVMYLLVKRK